MNTGNKAAGFSLIELIMMVAIIGVLAAILIPAIQKQAEKYSEPAQTEPAPTATMEFKGVDEQGNWIYEERK